MIDNPRSISATSEDGHQLTFNIDECVEIAEHAMDNFKSLIDRFVEYKTESADLGNIPAPSDGVQMEYLSLVDVFGKDKPNHFPKPDAKNENLHHVHVFDGTTEFEIDQWINKEQIKRVCDTLLFYSYFEHDEIHHFNVLQFIEDPNGHDYQKNNDEMKKILEYATTYRESIVNA